ncbi:DUF3499 domain-containing protein [Auritidibacter ignavus]|uniref:DUF3499 domain-containing protein n=1 Tax=Auritidibacter ignavus TaxID=678932 RepID=UPI002FE6520A
MATIRQCSKTGCKSPAAATLTFNYRDSTVVVGPMSQRAEPHAHDLCARHAVEMTAPVGWEMMRLFPDENAVPTPEPVADPDDLLALAHAVSRPSTDPAQTESEPPEASSTTEELDKDPGRTDRSVESAHTDTASGLRRPEAMGPEGPARPLHASGGEAPGLGLVKQPRPRYRES